MLIQELYTLILTIPIHCLKFLSNTEKNCCSALIKTALNNVFYQRCLMLSNIYSALLHLIAGLFWLSNIIHLMCAPEGNSEFCFPEGLNVSRDEVEGNIETRGKTKLTISRGSTH